MKAVTLTHNDFDGLGSLVMLMIKFKPEAYFFTNYYDFSKAVKQVIEYKREHDIDTLLIADLSFSDHPQLLERLNMVFEGNIFLVDHHMYPEGFWDAFSFKKIIDTTRCATRILFEDLKLDTDIKDPVFRSHAAEFAKMVDTWDRWQDEDPLFNEAMYHNELFLSLKTDNASIVQIAKDQIGHHFGIFQPEVIASFKAAYDQRYEVFKQELEDKSLIWRCPNTTFVFSWDFLPKVLEDEYSRGTKVVAAIQYGIVKVRVNRHVGFTEEQLNKLRHELTGMDAFCHMHAFTYKTEAFRPEQMVKECERIFHAVNALVKPGS